MPNITNEKEIAKICTDGTVPLPCEQDAVVPYFKKKK
jgi:hypothetical protein